MISPCNGQGGGGEGLGGCCAGRERAAELDTTPSTAPEPGAPARRRRGSARPSWTGGHLCTGLGGPGCSHENPNPLQGPRSG